MRLRPNILRPQRGLFIGGQSIPLPDLYDLKGEVIEDGGSYYFTNSVQPDKPFLITGYDWAGRAVTGFPYKSAATISAPAGWTELIAADTNNFWYASEGTPNQIPVVSLFQNIDYENKFFNKHSFQVLDTITCVEMSEPYVSRLVGYSTALVDNDLLKAQVYFVVPEKITAGAVWVSKDGNDTTGTGTELNPYLTLEKGDSVMNSGGGSTLYVKSGIYKENDVGSGGWYPRYAGTYQALGGVIVQGTTTRVITPTLNGVGYFKGFVFDAKNSLPTIARTLGGTINYQNCKFYNCSGSYNIDNSGPLTTNFTNCIFKPTAGTVLLNKPTGIVYGCYFAGTGTYGIYLNGGTELTYNIKHNIFAGTYAYSIYFGDGYNSIIFNNRFESVCTSWILNTASGVENSDITYNYFKGYTSGSSINYKNIGATLVKFNNNSGIISASQGEYFLLISDTNNEIKNNSISFLKTGNGSCIRVISTGTNCKTLIENNKLTVKTNGGYSIIVGSEVTHVGDDKIKASIIGNLITSDLFATNVCHNIFVGFEKDFVIKYNKVVNGGLAIICKANGDVSTTALVAYNLLDNCKQGLRLKGAQGVKIYNNTVNADNIDSAYYGIYIDRNINTSDNADVRNNIVNILSELGYCLYVDDSIFSFDYNNVYSTIADIAFINSVGFTYSELVTIGVNTNGVNINPNLTDFIPDTAITGGYDTGYDTGLNIATDWSGLTPDIATKEQGEEWQIGAYILT